jgi:UTP--glucose-1-phosphate uridylyltransferase
VVEKDFEGFKRLFGKFVNETGPSVNWDKIERLPEGAVSLQFYIICPAK